MEFSAITWLFLIGTIILSLTTIWFVIILFQRFLRKKTIGTVYLLMVFGAIALAENINSISLWLSAYRVAPETLTGTFQIFYVSLYCLGLIFLYFFGNRHIIDDNEIIRTLYGVLTGVIVGVITSLNMVELFGAELPGFHSLDRGIIGGTHLVEYTPSLFLSLILLIPVALLILFRIALKLAFVQRRIKEPIAKRGTQYIMLSFISIAITLGGAVFFITPALIKIPALTVLGQVIRIVFTSSTMLFGYLGWVMPEWIRRRIRKKAWIVKELSRAETIEKGYTFTTSKTINDELLQAKEVSEP
ncbi:MAG: hypothetical protein GF308_06065 [Candidatus Heimdallarchaeota archaeon]|nr:hypothetical protein [Candidatus Heimdallarchaeota archaeon]